jgi:hypothetical protein
MKCAQRVLFEKNFPDASASFDTAMQSLTQRIGVCPKSEFAALSEQLDRAWAGLESARSALDDHIREHCCLAERGNAGTSE